MIKNYFITDLRNFRHNKAFTLINVLGLSVGISAALVIYLIVQYDFSFESFQKDKDRIYRITTTSRSEDGSFSNPGVAFPLAEIAGKELTGIDGYSSFLTDAASKTTIPAAGYKGRTGAAEDRTTLAAGNARPTVYKAQKNIILADRHYFDLFPIYQWIAGSPASALEQPFTTVLSTDRAQLYFPGLAPADIIGRTVLYDDSVNCTITGIVQTPVANTDFTFKEFISRKTADRTSLHQYLGPDWQSVTSSSQLFVRLSPQTSPEQIQKQLAVLRKKYAPQKAGSSYTSFHSLQPLGDLHFNSEFDNFDQRVADKSTLYGLLVVAAFLLILGCINFINLTTAQGAQRAKEIGIRKTMGGSRVQLIFQFLGEAFLLTTISTLLSLSLAPWLLHLFADFIPNGLHVDFFHQPHLQLFLLLLILVVSVLAGFYPALVLSGYQPILVLKNHLYTGTGVARKAWTRKSLTVLQFVIAQAFIMATLIVSRQIHYLLEKDMGFRKNAIVLVETPSYPADKAIRQQLLLDHLRAIPGIEKAAGGGMPPAIPGSMSMGLTYNNGHKAIFANVELKLGDSLFVQVYGLRLLAGRYIHPTDSLHELVINQTYARVLGFQQPLDAIGKVVYNEKPYTIVGVVADFNQSSLRRPIRPLAIGSNNEDLYYVHIALQPQAAGSGSWKTTIAAIGKAFNSVYPDDDYNPRFFDESIARFYKSEQNMRRLLTWATALTVFISCLGLLGLVIYATRQRTKEIGIRKVLGASVLQIVSILSKDFVKLVGLAFLVAVPIAWYATHKWLDNYVFRAGSAWWLFPLSGLAMLGIALLTLSIRTIHAANANPADSLRTE